MTEFLVFKEKKHRSHHKMKFSTLVTTCFCSIFLDRNAGHLFTMTLRMYCIDTEASTEVGSSYGFDFHPIFMRICMLYLMRSHRCPDCINNENHMHLCFPTPQAYLCITSFKSNELIAYFLCAKCNMSNMNHWLYIWYNYSAGQKFHTFYVMTFLRPPCGRGTNSTINCLPLPKFTYLLQGG